MQEFSKFKAITAGIILLFVFAVAAIYSNTKEAAEMNKMKNISDTEKQVEQLSTELVSQTNLNTKEQSSNEIVIQNLSERIESLEKQIAIQKNNQQEGVRCNIRGIIDNGRIVPLPPDEAISESKINDREVLITCIFR